MFDSSGSIAPEPLPLPPLAFFFRWYFVRDEAARKGVPTGGPIRDEEYELEKEEDDDDG